jgi:hypothetical protein
MDTHGNLLFLGNQRRPTRPKKDFSRAYMQELDGAKIVVPTVVIMKRIVDEWHEHAHDGRERLQEGLSRFYMFHGMRDVINETRKDCERCNEFQRVPKTTQAILTSRKYELVMYDLFKLPMPSVQGEIWVMLVKDHFTKFQWSRAFSSKEMGPIAEFMLEIFMDTQVPERFHCDNGKEFVNQCMDEAMRMLNARTSHGKPRHPQTQGLIERANGTLKTKILKKSIDGGYTTPGQVFDWAKYILKDMTDNENDVCVKIYRKFTPFTCMHGVPRASGNVRCPTAHSIERMHEYMRQCQLARAFKKKQFPVLEDLQVGTIVNVLATKKELKDKIALSAWSARGIVHKVCPMSEHAFALRWLSRGLCTATNRRKAAATSSEPGTISPYYMRGQLRKVVGRDPAVVYPTEDGTALITCEFPDDTCNYTLLDGDWQGEQYNDVRAAFTKESSISYCDYTMAGRQETTDETEGQIRRRESLHRTRQDMEEPGGQPLCREELQKSREWFKSENPAHKHSIPDHVKEHKSETRPHSKRKEQELSRVTPAKPRTVTPLAKKSRSTPSPVASSRTKKTDGVPVKNHSRETESPDEMQTTKSDPEPKTPTTKQTPLHNPKVQNTCSITFMNHSYYDSHFHESVIFCIPKSMNTLCFEIIPTMIHILV